MPDTMIAPSVAPVRDLCPALRNVRLRLRRRLAAIEKEIAMSGWPAAHRDARMTGLSQERERILGALAHVATASERGLPPEERVRLLEALLAHLPGCVTQKARARVRLLIEGLDSSVPA
ncbi:MAG TPA: hypothetical protein VF348_01650 [Usitatibacter sp.]